MTFLLSRCRQRERPICSYLAPTSGVKRACSAGLPASVTETTAFMSGVDAYLPEPLSRLSPSGARLAVAFDLPARIVTVPVAPSVRNLGARVVRDDTRSPGCPWLPCCPVATPAQK